MKKRGQGTSGAGGLILIIAILIILYILFMPPKDRAALLGENQTTAAEAAAENASSILLHEFPGTIYPQKQDTFQHNLGTFHLYTKSEDSVIKSKDAMSISKDHPGRILLVLDDLANTKNALLSFSVSKHSGRLIILLNDEEIFNGEVSSAPEPIKLDSLQKENLLDFKVADPGIMFWKTNSYELRDIKVTGTINNLENQQATSVFLLQDAEYSNIKSASMVYLVECNALQVGNLKLFLNDVEIASRVPDCGSPDKVIIDPQDFRRGKNELRFFTDKGSYLIDNTVLTVDLKEPIFPIYYFELNATQHGWVEADTKNLILTIRFVDDNALKQAILNINGHKSVLETYDSGFTKNIDVISAEGNNYIMIEPRTNLPIVDLRVQLLNK